MNFKFKEQYSDIKRRADINKIREKYPDRIPIICEKDKKSIITDLDKYRYLVKSDLTASQFSFVIRKRLGLNKSLALFLLVNGKHSIQGETTLGEIYEKYGDPDDGFLYILYSAEIIYG